MGFIREYLSANYMTIMILLSLLVVVFINRRHDLEGVGILKVVMLVALAISVLEYVEVVCDRNSMDIWILYLKTMLVYWLYPMCVLLEIYLTIPVRHKVLIALPEAVNMLITLIDLSGTCIVYGFHEDHSFYGGPLRAMPLLLICFYTIVLSVHAVKMLISNNRQKGAIILFISAAQIATTIFEYFDFAKGYADEITALGLLMYYWYINSVYQNNIQAKLYQSKLELEQSNNKLLMAQIQPHFINNSLMALRSYCKDYPQIYDSITNFSLYLRSHFDALGDIKQITFEQEMENIEAYLALEQQNFGDRLCIEYDIECDDFLLPALTVQPLVENAVRHGVGTYDKGGTVRISTHRIDGKIIIEVSDDGTGGLNITPQQKTRKGIGIENVRARLKSIIGGELDVITGEHGTTARIVITDTSLSGGEL